MMKFGENDGGARMIKEDSTWYLVRTETGSECVMMWEDGEWHTFDGLWGPGGSFPEDKYEAVCEMMEVLK